MGYTHHWRFTEDIPKPTWNLIKADVVLLIEMYPGPGGLCRSADHHVKLQPAVTGDQIWFNGAGLSGCEDFLLTRQFPSRKFTQYCKTEHQPYDRMVCAVLAVIRDRYPAIEIESNGNHADWAPYIEWCSAVLKRPIANPFPPPTV
jgi:hypothetical protein